MKRARSVVFLAILLSFPVCSSAQNWSGIIDPSRAIDWSAGNVGVAGGIPSATWTQSGATIAAYSGTAATITNALHACSGNHFVLLGAGTFNLTTGIDFSNGGSGTGTSNCVLRGAGANSTFLAFSHTGGCIIFHAAICVSGSSYKSAGGNVGTVYNWTAGYSAGTTVITLNSVAGLVAGNLIILDQLNDTTDTGNLIVCDSKASEGGFICSQEAAAPGRNCTVSNAVCRAQHQYVKIVSIANPGSCAPACSVTITPGLYMPNWRSGKTPQAYTTGVIGSDIGTLIGVENLSVDTTGDGGDSSSNIEIGNCYQCWVRGVRSIRTQTRNHFWLFQATRAEVRDSYIYDSQGTSQAYGVEAFYTGDNLVTNNIMQRTTGAMEVGGDVGSVWAYNFAIYNYETVVNAFMILDVAGHDAGNALDLFEGNIANGFGLDDIHGTSAFLTAFRNQFQGFEGGLTNGVAKASQTNPVIILAYDRIINLIGNIVGTPGYHTNYEDAVPSGTNSNASIYVLGWSGPTGTNCCSVLGDTAVKTTLMRWGNYDVVHASNQFVSGEVPSGISPYGNAVPATQNLPASFFLSSKPGWIPGAKPWPIMGPDVTNGNVGICSGGTYNRSFATLNSQCAGGSLVTAMGGHVNSIPAMDCFLTTMAGPPDGTGNLLAFDAAACYGAAVAKPGPPMTPSAVIH